MDNLWIEAAIKKYESDNQIFKISKIEVEGGIPKGDNYASVIIRGKLEVVLGSGRKTTKSVIIKEKHAGKKGETLDKLNPFKVETKAYTDILRPMSYIMEEFEDNRDKFWCEMYGFKPYTTLMFENLSTKGFVVAERRNALDIDHAKLVLDAFGRFHAMSKILMNRGILTENDLPPYYFFSGWELAEQMFPAGMRQLSRIMIDKWPSDMKEVAERIAKQESIIMKRFKELQYSDENLEFKVINHGGPWTCNMMFKYDEKTKAPINLKLIDFQVCHVSSYIFDVLYFVYTSVQPKLRRQNLKQLYKFYWESLSSNLIKFGYTEKIPSYDDVLKEAEKKDYFSFAVLAICYPGMIADLDQSFDLEKINNKESSGSLLDDRALSASNFIEQCSEDFKNFVKKGVI